MRIGRQFSLRTLLVCGTLSAPILAWGLVKAGIVTRPTPVAAVSGRVMFADGTPFANGILFFRVELPQLQAYAVQLQDDGSFDVPDTIRVGNHGVFVGGQGAVEVDGTYGYYGGQSPLRVVVRRGKNVFDIVVPRKNALIWMAKRATPEDRSETNPPSS